MRPTGRRNILPVWKVSAVKSLSLSSLLKLEKGGVYYGRNKNPDSNWRSN